MLFDDRETVKKCLSTFGSQAIGTVLTIVASVPEPGIQKHGSAETDLLEDWLCD